MKKDFNFKMSYPTPALATVLAHREPRATPAIGSADLVPLEVYELLRATCRRRIIALKARRRVLLGPHLSLLFESRETVLFQIHEVIWLERLRRPERILAELAEYEPLVPRAGELTATLMIHGGPPGAGQELMQTLTASPQTASVFLQLDGRSLPAEPISALEEASCPVQYLRFPLDKRAEAELLDPSRPVGLGVRYAGRLELAPLSTETRAELAAELRDVRSHDGRWAASNLFAIPQPNGKDYP